MTKTNQTRWERRMERLLVWVHDNSRRRKTLAWVFGVSLLLSVFPQPSMVVVSLTPSDSSASLMPALGALGAFSSYMNTQNISEVQLRVARSVEVRKLVIDKLKLNERWHSNNMRWLEFKLGNEVTLRTARGGILLLEAKGFDPEFSQQLLEAYIPAIKQRLAELSREQTDIKRTLLKTLLDESTERMKVAESRLDQFRRSNDAPEPMSAFLSASTRLPALLEMRRAKEMQLQVLRQFQTEKSIEAQSVIAEIAGIDQQIAAAKAPNSQEAIALDRVIPKSTELGYLIRDVEFARALYLSYAKLLEGTSLEDLVSSLSLRVLEPAHVDPTLQFNWLPLLLAVFILLGELTYFVIQKR